MAMKQKGQYQTKQPAPSVSTKVVADLVWGLRYEAGKQISKILNLIPRSSKLNALHVGFVRTPEEVIYLACFHLSNSIGHVSDIQLDGEKGAQESHIG